MKFWIIYFLVQISFFGTVLRRFSQCKLKTCFRWPTMVAEIFSNPLPQHKKASYGPAISLLQVHFQIKGRKIIF